MKTGRSILELAHEVERQAQTKRDFVAKTSAIELSYDQEFERLLKLNVGDHKFGLNDLAHSQIGEYCAIPKAYYDRCRAEDPELLIHNVNRWIASHKDEKRLVRTLDGSTRAFLSDAYRPLENIDLANAILPVLLNTGKFDIMSCEVTERRLYIKAVGKELARELAKTGNRLGDGQHKIVDVIYPAVVISNSEVGYGQLSIEQGVWTRGCSNLATMAARSLKKRHVGARHGLLSDDLVSQLSDETRKKTDEALWCQVRDVVAGTFDPARFDEVVDTLNGSQEDRIDRSADVVEVVKTAGNKLGFTETEGKGILQHLIEGGDLSRYGLFNAVTRFSQDVESYDRASELEKIGGNVIELPRNDWQQIARAS